VEVDVESVVARGTRCWVAAARDRGLLLTPTTYWSDGDALWAWTLGSSEAVETLARDPRCAVYVAAPDGGGAVLRGRARIHSAASPRSVLFHGVTSVAALAALAARNAPNVVGYVADGPRIPRRALPANRVVIRIGVDATEPVGAPPKGPGIAPALPTVVPSDLRRALSGRRDVVVAAGGAGALQVASATWGPGYALALPAGMSLAEGAPAAVALETESGGRPTAVAGLRLSGTVDGGRLRADRVSWWDAATTGTAGVQAAGPSSGPAPIVLPD